MRPGGAAVNVAMALAKRGLRAGVAAVIGEDALGEALAARVTDAGAVAAFDRSLPRTGLLFAERRDDEARFVGYRAADEPPPRVPDELEARAVLLTGVMPSPQYVRALRDVAKKTRALGATVLVDVNARPRVWRGQDPQAALDVIAEADVVKASADDLRLLGIERAIEPVLRAGATLVTTDGAGPARARGAFGDVSCAPPRLLRGDALGAGDAFMAGLLVERLRSEANDAVAWERALHAGHAEARARMGRRMRQPRRIAR